MKKHDKQSCLSLREAITAFVGNQSFYTSTLLASTFTHAQCIASEVLAAQGDELMAEDALVMK